MLLQIGQGCPMSGRLLFGGMTAILLSRQSGCRRKNDDPQLEEILPEDALNMMSGMIPLRVNAVCSFPLLDKIFAP